MNRTGRSVATRLSHVGVGWRQRRHTLPGRALSGSRGDMLVLETCPLKWLSIKSTPSMAREKMRTTPRPAPSFLRRNWHCGKPRMSCDIPSNSSPPGFCCEFSFSSPLHVILNKRPGKADNEDGLLPEACVACNEGCGSFGSCGPTPNSVGRGPSRWQRGGSN